MDNWKGMTEPLKVGDPVRIVRCDIAPEHIGIVTEVVAIIPAGTRVKVVAINGHARLKTECYGLKEPPNSSWGRNRLYKLPPDFFDTLDKRVAVDDSPLAKFVDCKRLQEQDS